MLVWIWGFVAPLTLVGCGRPPTPDAPEASSAHGQVQEIDVAELRQKLEANEIPILVDVRTTRERASGSVPGSVSIPMSEIPSRLAELEEYRNRPIYLVCQSGNRSGRVATFLADQGYTAVNVRGGTGAWKARGWPVE